MNALKSFLVLGLLVGLLAAAPGQAAQIEVVESFPLETDLGVPGVRQTQEVWLEMFRAAQTQVDIEQFYVSDQAGEALAPVLASIKDAAARGVRVRLLVDSKFFKTYPDSVNELGKLPNVQTRTIDFSETNGVQHAKFFTIDGQQSFVGSQNFD
ncbi:MAG: phospholipase, partial [Deltaproteobacteria bacterium]|nr:phospholipase [Deltaproteobacteria bacterium]